MALSYTLPSLQEVDEAWEFIRDKVTVTPVETSASLAAVASLNLQKLCATDASQQCDIKLFFKCENLQRTGSFKFRGASHFLARLQDHELSAGVVAHSTGNSIVTVREILLTMTGNHAQAVAHAAQLASLERGIHVPAYVVVSSNCRSKKISAARDFGANVFLSDPSPDARIQLASQLQASTGAIPVPSSDHRCIALGQATSVREFLQQVAEMGDTLDAIIVPSGGGGLLVGAAAVCKPQGVLVFGAEPASGGPGLAAALLQGVRPVSMGGACTIADGLRTVTGEANWEIIKSAGNIEAVFSVSEWQIKESLRLAVETFGFTIEPSAAVPLAVALFSDQFHRRMARMKRRSIRVGVVLTGGNISGGELLEIVPGLRIDAEKST
jgi:threonine dehydratase